MNPSRLFILRPVATSLMMVGVLLVGIVAYRQLPVSALPEVDYPTIQVMTFYPGADPTVMASSVTAPLERQFGQVPGLSQMTSTSSLGSSVITLQFNLDQNIDIAEQEVQAAINSAGTYLPADLPNPPIYSKVNPADAPILTLALTSDTLPLSKVEDLADTQLAQKISQVTGVGLVIDQRRTEAGGAHSGESDRAGLLWLGPGRRSHRARRQPMSIRPRHASTVRGSPTLSALTISWSRASRYKPIVIAYRNGAPVRLSRRRQRHRRRGEHRAGRVDGISTPAVIVNIQRQPGATSSTLSTDQEAPAAAAGFAAGRGQGIRS